MQYKKVQSAISTGGALNGLKALGYKTTQADKNLFLSGINETGNLPDLVEKSNGFDLISGNKKVFIEFSNPAQGQFKVGGYNLQLNDNSTLESVYHQIEKAQASIEFSKTEQNLLDQALSAVFIQDAAAGWGMWLGIAAIALGAWILYKAGKNKGIEEQKLTQRRQQHRDMHHGGGSYFIDEGTVDDGSDDLQDDGDGDEYVGHNV